MSGDVTRDGANRQSGSVAVTVLIGLLLAFLAQPLCAAAFTCTMPCCEHSGVPMDDHGAMPAPACGTERSLRAVAPAGVEVLVSPGAGYVLSLQVPRVLSDSTPSSSSRYSSLRYPRSNTRPLYVVNDAFLI